MSDDTSEAAAWARYQELRKGHDARERVILTEMRRRWTEVAVGLAWVPNDALLLQLLRYWPPEVVGDALEDVGYKVSSGYLEADSLRADNWRRYLWRVARTLGAAVGIEHDGPGSRGLE